MVPDRGEVTERLKVLASKASVRETVPQVRIPPSPPELPWSRLHRDLGCGLERPQSASSSNPTLSARITVVPVAPGFRLRARTPAKRLKFESHPLRHFLAAAPSIAMSISSRYASKLCDCCLEQEFRSQ